MMNIEIIAIGNEVLRGFTANTNATYIAKRLTFEGYNIQRCTVVPDEPSALISVWKEALSRSDVVIATGGLGPTGDDITRQVAAILFDSGFRYDASIAEKIISKWGKEHTSLKDQATIPEKATAWSNPIGTAPGLLFESELGTLILLPGVPPEMKELLKQSVLPYLQERSSEEESRFYETIHLFGLPESKVDPLLRELSDKSPDVEFGIYPSLGTLTLRLGAQLPEQLLAPKREILDQFGRYAFEAESGYIEEALQRKFTQKGWTLSTAESCTGGAIASRITRFPGSSDYFLGSVVSYANEVKTNVLGVDPEIIEQYGAVSEEVVKQMAQGILKLTGSEFSVAVSGVAGPSGGTEEKPVGTVWCAVCRKGEVPYTWKIHAKGNRQTIIHWSGSAILNELYLRSKAGL